MKRKKIKTDDDVLLFKKILERLGTLSEQFDVAVQNMKLQTEAQDQRWEDFSSRVDSFFRTEGKKKKEKNYRYIAQSISRVTDFVLQRESGREALSQAPQEILLNLFSNCVTNLSVEEATKIHHHFLQNVPATYRAMFYAHYNFFMKMDYDRHDIHLFHSSRIIETRLKSVQKERFTVDWIENTFKPGDVFYDVGANVGAYSLIAAKFFGGQVKIFSFEPAFFNHHDLCRNIIENDCSSCIVPVMIALNDKRDVIPFSFSSLESGAALHSMRGTQAKGHVALLPIVGMPMDDVISVFKLPKPHHIKLDVDGGELFVLKGAQQTLTSGHVKSIMVELESPPVANDIDRYLKNTGFYQERVYERSHKEAPPYAIYKWSGESGA